MTRSAWGRPSAGARWAMSREPRLAQDVARPHHARRDAPLEEELLHGGAVDPVLQQEGEAHPRRLDLGGGAGTHHGVLVEGEHLVEPGEVLPAPFVELGEPVELHVAVRGADLRRLEVVAGVLEQEDQIVGRAVGERAEPVVVALLAAEQVPLGMTPPSAAHEGLVEPLGIVDRDHAAVARGGDRVTAREARDGDVGTRAGACAAQVRVEHVAAVFDHEQSVRVGDGTDGVPVGAVPDEVRREDRLRAGPDHGLDLGDVDLQRVGLDVDERGDDPLGAPAARCRSRT